MKKLSFIVAMALAVVANYSCGEYDNSVLDNGKTTITDANGNPYEVDAIASFLANPGDEVKVGIQVTDGEDYYALKSGDNIVTAQVNDQEIVTLTLNEVGENGEILLLGNNNIQALTIDNAYLADVVPEKIANLVTLGISNIDADEMELPKFGKLENFSLLNTGLESIILGDNSDLKTLTINNNKNLKALDLKDYYQLETVDLSQNALANIEFSNEYKALTDFNASENQLTAFDPSVMRNVKNLDLHQNKIEGEIDLTVCNSLETVDLEDNELSSVVAGKAVEKYVDGEWATEKTGNVKTLLNIANNKLGFGAMPLIANIEGEYIYAPQKPIDVILAEGILDLSAHYDVDGNITTYEFDPEETEVDRLKNGRFAFPEAVNGVVVNMTNAAFPGLTVQTVEINSEAASNIIYSFNPATDVNATGGTIEYVHSATGNKEIDGVDYLHYQDELMTKNYTTILLDGTKASLAKAPYHYVRINLDEPLKKGNVLRFTGFRMSMVVPSEEASIYLLFDKLNNNSIRLGNDYKPGMEKTFEFNGTLMFNNIWENSLLPSELTLTVSDAIAGSESFKFTRNIADTNIYITKIEILRKAEPVIK